MADIVIDPISRKSQILVELGKCPSLEEARRLVLNGEFDRQMNIRKLSESEFLCMLKSNSSF
jgi:hypothetical protein